MRPVLFACLLSAAAGCATAGGAAPAVAVEAAEAAEPAAVVRATIDGFRAEDWSAVEANLSAGRRGSLNEGWFALWRAEVLGATRLQVAETVVEGETAKVMVKLALNGQEHVTAVRLVREGGQWKWDER